MTKRVETYRETVRCRTEQLELRRLEEARKALGRIMFWSRISGVPSAQFRKPYIKKSQLSDINYHMHGHGTCNILFGNGLIKQAITAEIKVVMDFLNMHP